MVWFSGICVGCVCGMARLNRNQVVSNMPAQVLFHLLDESNYASKITMGICLYSFDENRGIKLVAYFGQLEVAFGDFKSAIVLY